MFVLSVLSVCLYLVMLPWTWMILYASSLLAGCSYALLVV